MSAPLGQDLLVDFARIVALSTCALFLSLLAVGAVGYFYMCLRASRQWNGHEERWARPPVPRR